MSNAVELKAEQFDETIREGVTLVDFWAAWCGPCRMLAPTLDEIASLYEGRVKVCKVNVDENQELATQYGVRSIPTIVFFKDGAQADTLIGVNAKKVFEDKLNGLLA